MKIFVKCSEANHTCDKSQYNEATFWEKVKLNIHLLYCRACRKYTARNRKLTKLMKNPEIRTLNTSEKNLIKERLRQNMGK